jgi:glycosyltransferase involved in cell wall biosynthesis
MRILMLTPHMKMGFGVAEAVANLATNLSAIGIQTTTGCLEHDKYFSGLDVRRVAPDPVSVLDAAARVGAKTIVAHGSPYFELLPALTDKVRTVAYEYGDPTPEMFAYDAEERRRIADFKKVSVYPHVDVVAAISEFIRHDIGWPDAEVVRLGIEHVPDLGPKPLVPPRRHDGPLRIGTLMRLGSGEARYKGNSQLLRIKDEVIQICPHAQFEVMGRGTAGDALSFEAAGFQVSLNATAAERTEFLRSIDVFISPSQWEGTNLPLVEAAALGTPALAFDTGSHPEFTPLVFSRTEQIVQQIVAYDADRSGLLRDHGAMCYQYVRRGMSWHESALEFGAIVSGRRRSVLHRPLRARVGTRIGQFRSEVSANGWRSAATKAYSTATGGHS